MNVTMLTDMVLQSSNYGKQTAAALQQNVQSAFSFSSELRKQLNTLNKEVNKATPKATTSSSKSEAVETDKAETEDKEERSAAAAVVSPQTLQAALAPQVLNAVDCQTQMAAPEELLLGQPQDSVVQAVNTVQDVSAVTTQVVQTAADMPQPQSVTTQPRQNVTSEYLSQQGNPEVVQSATTQSSTSFTPSGSFQNQADAQTSNQSSAQSASESAPVTADKQATEKSDKDTVQQLTQQLSSFNEKLHNLGVTLKAEATAASTVPTAQQTSPSEQVATGVLNAYSDGKMEFTMKLKPETLGELTVKMVMNDGKITMNIITGNQQTAKLIESQIPELRASLKDSNIQMESCTVENQSFNNLASSGNFFMSGSDRGNQPYETRRIVLARPIQEISSDETTLAGGIIGARYVQQAVLNCYV